MAEKVKNELVILDASPESVKEMISYMYTGKVPANISEIVADLLHLADKYEMASLKKACERCLLKDLAVENTVNTLILVDRWQSKHSGVMAGISLLGYFRYKGSPQLRDKVLEFFQENSTDVVESRDWTTALETGKYAKLFSELVVFISRKRKRTASCS